MQIFLHCTISAFLRIRLSLFFSEFFVISFISKRYLIRQYYFYIWINYRKKKDQLIFSSTWHQEFQCKGKGWFWLEVDAEDDPVTKACVSRKSLVA